MRRIINNIISVTYSAVRIFIYKIFYGKNFKSGLIERISPNVILEFNKRSKVVFGKRIRIHGGSKVKVRSGAELFVGDGAKINYNCMIVCHEKIEIGEGTEFGPSVYVYDHDHDYRIGLKEDQFRKTPVKIGKNCWIGANSIILRGTEIGDNCVVAAGSILKGKFKDNSLIYTENKLCVKKIEYVE